MNHRSHFFNTIAAPQESAVHYIHIGGEQFHAAAVALIDHLRYALMPANSLKKLLDGFFTHFPQYKPTQAYLTPAQRMATLLSNPRKSELVECMAYTLRQLAVNELLAHPLNYPDVFANFTDKTSINSLRDLTTVLATEALDALAQALDIAIALSFKERNKPLRRCEIFNKECTTQLTLQVQAGIYYPQVRNKADFVYVGQLAINPPKPVICADEGSLASLMAVIDEYKKELAHDYAHMHKTLMCMNAAGELPKSKLINLYISFLPKDSGALRCERLIAELDATLDKNKLTLASADAESEFIHSITSALAGWLCTKQIDEEQFFARMEERPGTRAISAV